MRRWFKGLISWWAIHSAMKRPAPSTIPLSGEDRLRGRNYYSVHVGVRRTELFFLVRAISGAGIRGILWTGDDQVDVEAPLPNAALSGSPVVITHYYREAEINYGPLSYLLGRFVHWSWLRLSYARFLQWKFNRKPLVRIERYDVLRWAYDRGIALGRTDISAEMFLRETSSLRWMRHPMGGETQRYYDLVFESLLGSGDLLRSGQHGYRLAPQALATLSRLEEDNRRHKDNLRQQSIMAVLTSALILVGLPAALDAGRKLIWPEVEQRGDQVVEDSTTAPAQEAPAPD